MANPPPTRNVRADMTSVQSLDERFAASGSAWALHDRLLKASGEEAVGSVIRERLISEYSNSGVVAALLLTIVAAYLAGNPVSDVDDPRQRVFMFASALCMSVQVMMIYLSLTLIYQLNMLPTDDQVRLFILELSRWRIPLLTSGTGLPDIMMILTVVGALSFMTSVMAAVHVNSPTVDAWVITGLVGFCNVPLLLFVVRLDAWKWRQLQSQLASHSAE